MIRRSAVGIVTAVRVGRPRNCGSVSGREQEISFVRQNVHTGCGVNAASYVEGTGSSFCEGKAAGASCRGLEFTTNLHGVYRGNFIFGIFVEFKV